MELKIKKSETYDRILNNGHTIKYYWNYDHLAFLFNHAVEIITNTTNCVAFKYALSCEPHAKPDLIEMFPPDMIGREFSIHTRDL